MDDLNTISQYRGKHQNDNFNSKCREYHRYDLYQVVMDEVQECLSTPLRVILIGRVLKHRSTANLRDIRHNAPRKVGTVERRCKATALEFLLEVFASLVGGGTPRIVGELTRFLLERDSGDANDQLNNENNRDEDDEL